MSVLLEHITINKADISKARLIVALFNEDGDNQYNWCEEKWAHYYVDYPEGNAISLIAELNGEVIGHYGLLPVQIGNWPAMLGLHAYVSKKFRGLTIISELMTKVDAICKENKIALLCGFANPKFALISKTFFKWKIPVWLGVNQDIKVDDLTRNNARFYFKYSDSWNHWRFGKNKNMYISRYRDNDGKEHKQLLKVNSVPVKEECVNLLNTECWSPNMNFEKDDKNYLRQPFSIKIYEQMLIEDGVMNPANWFIEMGDSDTFTYIPWN